MTDIILTDEQKKIVQQMDELIAANGGKIEHDLSIPLHRDYLKLMHNLAGNNEKDFPGLHKMIDEAGAMPPAPSPNYLVGAAAPSSTDGWETTFGIPEVGVALGTNLAAANGYGTVVDGFQVCNLSLLVRDVNGNFIAHGSNAGYAPYNSLAVGTDNSTAKAAASGMTAQMSYSYMNKDGVSFSSTVYAPPPAAISDPTVTEPKRENGNTNPYAKDAIIIGLGRPPGYLSGCDYIYYETIQDHPVGRVPLVGSVSFTQQIRPLQPGTNFTVDIVVVRTDKGGQASINPTDMENVYQNFYIDPSDPTGKKLSWNLPMEANVTNPPTPPPVYNPVVFNNIPWSSDMKAYLTVNIWVTLQDGTPVNVIIQSVDGHDGDPLDGIAYIMPIEFIWHCLGDDTKVTLPDGSLKPITDFVANDKIKTGTGIGTVSVTHMGPHPGNVLKIETDKGHSLVTSTHHIIMTPKGGKYAHLLSVGDKVITLEGSAKVSKVKELPSESRKLWNLSLGHASHRDDPTPEVGTFFANGILVGDARAERAMRHACGRDIKWVKAHVDKRFHKDVESAFKMRKKGRASRMLG